MAGGGTFTINSTLDFTYREDSNTAGIDFRSMAVSAIGANIGGTIKLLGNQVKITAQGQPNQNVGLGIFSLLAHSGGKIYLNAKDDGSISNPNAIIQLTGSISTGMKRNYENTIGNGKIYANLTGSQSYLNGNIYSGRYGGNSEAVISFTNNAQMRGDIVFLDSSSAPTSKITFTNAKLTGDINALGSGNHNVVFDQSSFIGTIKKDYSINAIQNTTLDGTVNGIVNVTGNIKDTSLGHQGSGANTTITFTNTAGKVFGSGDKNIVDSSFTGNIIGSFDLSAKSITTINGGADGSKGFFGSEIGRAHV